MPCTYYGPGEEADELRKQLDTATRLLCRLCGFVEATGRMGEQPGELRDWWEDHQRRDREREEADLRNRQDEAARRSALLKLTPDERRALGH